MRCARSIPLLTSVALVACHGGTADVGDATPDASVCPAGWLCFAQPLYKARVGVWYTNIWHGSSVAKPPGEVFNWNVSRYQPAAGFYESDDTVSLTTHLDEMNAAGIDFMILDGTNGFTSTLAYNTDVLIHTELGRPAAKRVPLAFALGANLWAAPADSPTAVANHQHEVDMTFADFYSNETPTFRYATALNQHPGTEPIANAFYRWQSKPLVVVYNSFAAGGNGLTWTDPRLSVRNSTGVVHPAAPETLQYGAHGWWGWVTEYPQLISAEEIGVTPGADNTHRGCSGCDYHLDRENGALLEREWLRAISANPDAIVLAAWNDFVDETAIEPASPTPLGGAPKYTDSYGDEVPDLYLQIVTAYGNLRVGLMANVVYRDVDDPTMYRVTAGQLVVQSAMPHGQPVIELPAATLAAVRMRH